MTSNTIAPPTKHSGYAALALLANALIWGTSWWPFRYLNNQGLHPIWSTCLVSGIALILSGLLYRHFAWREISSNRDLWVLCLAAGITNICFNWAVSFGDVLRVVLLFYFMPAWSVLLAWWLLREKPNAASSIQLPLAFIGLFLILKSPESTWPFPQNWTDWLALIGGFFFALNNTMLRRLSATSNAARLQAMFIGGFVATALFAFPAMSFSLLPAWPTWDLDWVLFASLFAALILFGNLALQYGAAKLLARTTALIMLSEVFFAAVSSILAGTSTLKPMVVLGGSLIFVSALWSIFDNQKRKAA